MATPTSTTEETANVEGAYLLGQPTFSELENGRFRCVETGHEVLAKDTDSYSRSKRCRFGLIDFALSHRKSPLNMFEQDLLSLGFVLLFGRLDSGASDTNYRLKCSLHLMVCSKLKCKLTGDTINKTEEHIWKHINGKRFLNKLDQMELEKGMRKPGMGEKKGEKKAAKSKTLKPSTEHSNKKKKMVKGLDQTVSEPRESSCVESDREEAFWMPPVGQRWDRDDGGDRWGSGSDSEPESEKVNAIEEDGKNGGIESDELTKRTKRMSIEIGPNSFASRKKKSKKSST